MEKEQRRKKGGTTFSALLFLFLILFFNSFLALVPRVHLCLFSNVDLTRDAGEGERGGQAPLLPFAKRGEQKCPVHEKL